MSDIHLLPDEMVLLQREDVNYEQGDPSHISEMYLTNKRIICIGERKKGFFKTEEVQQMILIDHINIVAGQLQATCQQKSMTDAPFLEIFCKDGKRTFIFGGGDFFHTKQKAEVVAWVDMLNHVLLNKSIQTQDANNVNAIPGAEAIANALMGTVGVIAKAFSRPNQKPSKAVITTCPGCGAKLSGYQGQTKYCEHCGSPISFD